MLHIQMQLCELSLWDWIADRNQRGRESVDESACEYRGASAAGLGNTDRAEGPPSASSCFRLGEKITFLKPPKQLCLFQHFKKQIGIWKFIFFSVVYIYVYICIYIYVYIYIYSLFM